MEGLDKMNGKFVLLVVASRDLCVAKQNLNKTVVADDLTVTPVPAT